MTSESFHNSDEQESSAVKPHTRKLFVVHLQVVIFFSACCALLDHFLDTAWTFSFAAGGLLMAAEIYLFETLAMIITSPEGELGAKKALVLLLIPMKLGLLLVPLVLYWEHGRSAMAPFAAGLMLILVSAFLAKSWN